MNRLLCLCGILFGCQSLFAATTPLLSDNFTVTANSTNVSIEIPGTRQTGSRAPLAYTEQDMNQDNYSQVNRSSYEGQLFMAAISTANLVKVSPNSNFNVSPGTNGVFYIEFKVNPVLNVAGGNSTATAWAAIKFGSLAQNKTVNDPDGFGILFRGEASRLFQAFDDGANVTPAGPNDIYTASAADILHSIRIELRRVTAGANLFDGSPVEIKMFVDGGASPLLTYVRNAGFTSNFISLISETEGSGGDNISRHSFDDLRITAAPAPSVTLTLPGGTSIDPNTSFAASAVETGVTSKVEFFVGAGKVGEDTTSGDGFTFNYAGLATGTYNLTTVTTDLFGATATSAPVAIIVSQKPTVAITAPQNGTLFASGTAFQVGATASDPDGTVAKVEFFRNGVKVGEDTNGADGYSLQFPSGPSGTQTLSAIATDNLGAQSTAASITVVASDPPVVALTSPLSGTILDEPSTLSLSATATDPDGSILKVEFLANGVKIAEDALAAGGYTASLPFFTPGAYTLTAVATDSVGLTTVSAPVSFRIRPLPKFDSAPTLSPNPALAGQEVSALASAAGATISWNWGDGSTSSGASVTHTYATPGVYTAVVTATNTDGVSNTQALAVFVGQNLFGTSGAGEGVEGVTGVLIGGAGVSPEEGASVSVSCNYVRRSQTSMRGVLNGIDFPAGITQDQLTNQPGTLRIGSGTTSIPFSFSLGANGRGRATSVKKIEVNLEKKMFSFFVKGQAPLTDLLESLGARREFGTSAGVTVRVPATLQIGTQLFIALTFEIDFTAKGTRGKGGLAK